MLPLAPVLALALSGPATPDAAGPERLAVLPVLLGEPAPTGVRAVFDAVEAAARLRAGLRVMSVDDYYFHEGRALARRALACGSDTRCMAGQLAPFDARLGLVVLVNGELSPPLVSVFLLDGEDGDVAAQWAGQVDGGEAAVTERLTSETARMLEDRGFLRSGRLKVRVAPDRATLMVGEDTAPDLGTSDTFTLLPGRYELRAVADGFEPGKLGVEVKAGEQTQVDLQLEPESSVLASPWLWIGVGAVAVGAAATATALALGGSSDPCICVVTKDMSDCGGCR